MFQIVCLVLTIVHTLVPPCDGTLSLHLLGEWGGTSAPPHTTRPQLATALHLAATVCRPDDHRIVSLGGNFKPRGVKDVYDPRWAQTWGDVYSGPPSLRDLPWLVMAGEADHAGNITAQQEYGRVSEERWEFMSGAIDTSIYHVEVDHSGGGGNTSSNETTRDFVQLQLITLDTVQLCGAPAHQLEPSPHADRFWDDLETTLNESLADYLLVAGHRPVFSAGTRGSNGCMIRRLLPLLYRYRVSAYLSADDEVLQHIATTHPYCASDGANSSANSGHVVHYVTSGAGAGTGDESGCREWRVYNGEVPAAALRYFWSPDESLGGFVTARVGSEGELTVELIETGNSARSLHEFSVPRRNLSTARSGTGTCDAVPAEPVGFLPGPLGYWDSFWNYMYCT